jgi:hypothetical protein
MQHFEVPRPSGQSRSSLANDDVQPRAWKWEEAHQVKVLWLESQGQSSPARFIQHHLKSGQILRQFFWFWYGGFSKMGNTPKSSIWIGCLIIKLLSGTLILEIQTPSPYMIYSIYWFYAGWQPHPDHPNLRRAAKSCIIVCRNCSQWKAVVDYWSFCLHA